MLPNYVHQTLANALINRTCEEDRTTSIINPVSSYDTRSGKSFRSYPEAVKFLLKKYVTDQAIVEYDAAILRYMQSSNVTRQQYPNDLIAKSCEVADVYDEATLKDVFIEGVDASVRRIHRHYWAQDSQADLTDIAFQAESLFYIQKGTDKRPEQQPR